MGEGEAGRRHRRHCEVSGRRRPDAVDHARLAPSIAPTMAPTLPGEHVHATTNMGDSRDCAVGPLPSITSLETVRVRNV